MQQKLTERSTREVFEDHLRLRVERDLEQDLQRNYAEDVTLLTVNSNARGLDAIRHSAARLKEQLPDARYQFRAKQVRDNFALLVWRAESEHFDAIEGSDTFLIEGGKIRLHTIHYGLVGGSGE